MVWFVSSGRGAFYRLIVTAELTDRSMVGVAFRATMGQGEVARRSRRARGS